MPTSGDKYPPSSPDHNHKGGAINDTGRRIVFALNDYTRMWNARSGLAVSKALTGHHFTNSVTYSPDGRHIISGGLDSVIRIWNAETGVVVGRPLTGHTDSFRSVAYSLDGRHIVSASQDNTIWIWDAETGVAVGKPLTRHTHLVDSVAYSPDG